MADLHVLQQRRLASLAMAGTGVALIFVGRLLLDFALGGVVMVVAGLVGALYYGYRIRRVKGDPWAYDPELDGPDPENRRDPKWDD